MRVVRRVLALYILLVVAVFVAAAVTARANAVTPSDPLASPTHWSIALVAGFLATQVIPVISALATKRPNHWTGIITLALSFVDMLCTSIAEAGNGIDWKQVLITTGLAFLAARGIAYKGIIEPPSKIGTWLFSKGNHE